VLYSLAIPNVAAICKSVSLRLTDYENYETHGSHEYHLLQKVFIFNALTSYMSILLTAYIYIPFGRQLISTFQSYGLPFAKVTIDPLMLQSRLKAFMITTQAVSFATETIVPWLTRRALVGAVKIQKEVSEKLHHESVQDEVPVFGEDSEEAKKFLNRVKKQVELPEYDVNEDYAEMVLQVKTTTTTKNIPQLIC
jgi:anoctamin-10